MQDISHNILVTNLKTLIESINNYKGKWTEDRSTKVGNTIEYNPWSAPITFEAMKFLYDNNLIVDFDWGSWDEGREFFKNENPNKYNSIDREMALKLLTAVARNDRFCDGAWAELFESGSAQKLFARLLEIEDLQ
jgi:hypothetical protein